MAMWRSLLGLVTGAGYRQSGLQNGKPGRYTKAATNVNIDTALQLSAVWACTRRIAESIGSLPLYVYKKNKDGSRVRDHEHHLAKLFSGKVNRWQTRQEYFETLLYQNVLLGNDYSAVQKNSNNQIIALVPLMSEQMQVTLQASGDVMYRYTDGNNVKIYSDQTIWHNKLFGNGIIGLNPLEYARNSIGIAQGAEQAVTKVYDSGGKTSGVLTMDKVLTPAQREQIRKEFSAMQESTDSGRLFVLEAGLNYQAISLSPQDMELLASRRFQIEDIARFFGVPSVLINDTNSSTAWGSGIQQIVEGFYKFGLRPYLERYESSLNARLLTAEERVNYELEFDFTDLVAPSELELTKSYKERVTGGIMTPNEARMRHGYEPKPGGNDLYMQQQMISLSNPNRGMVNKRENQNDDQAD